MKGEHVLEGLCADVLRTLGKEDLLFCHHGEVHARPTAYERMAVLFEEGLKARSLWKGKQS